MKKLTALILAIALMLTAGLALAKTVEPDDTEYERLAGMVVNATVGEYNQDTKTFTVTLYEDDCFDIEDLEKMEAGDTLLAGERVYKVKEKKEDENENIIVITEDGEEIVFVQVGDDHTTAESIEDNRRYMHAFAILHLPAAENIVYEDNSDPEKEEAAVTKGLEEILKIKAEKEQNSIGFDFYATIIELNDNMEIVRIHQDFDVAQ